MSPNLLDCTDFSLAPSACLGLKTRQSAKIFVYFSTALISVPACRFSFTVLTTWQEQDESSRWYFLTKRALIFTWMPVWWWRCAKSQHTEHNHLFTSQHSQRLCFPGPLGFNRIILQLSTPASDWLWDSPKMMGPIWKAVCWRLVKRVSEIGWIAIELLCQLTNGQLSFRKKSYRSQKRWKL